MPSFSAASHARLATCDSRLVEVFETVVKVFDCTIIEGARPEERQNELYRSGKSHLQYPHSKHNVATTKRQKSKGLSRLSRAVDVAPCPIDWNDRERFCLFAGYVLGIGRQMGIKLRWGGDWDRDWQVKDNHFDDLAHIELVDG